MKFSVAHPNPGKRSAENFTKIARQISRHLWQRKMEKIFTSALLQGSCSEKGPCQGLGVYQENLRKPATTTSQTSIAIDLQCVLQCASNLHCSTFGIREPWGRGNTLSSPPICIAIRLPFVSPDSGENTRCWGHRDAIQRS